METANKNPFMKFMYSDDLTTPDFLDGSISVISDITDTTRHLNYSNSATAAADNNIAKHLFEPTLQLFTLEQLQYKCNINNIQYSQNSNKPYLIFLLSNEFNNIYKKFNTLPLDFLIFFCKENNIFVEFENKEKIIQNIMKYNASYTTLNFIKYTDNETLTSGQKISKYFNNVYDPPQYSNSNHNICGSDIIKHTKHPQQPPAGYHKVVAHQINNEEEDIDAQIEKLTRQKNNLLSKPKYNDNPPKQQPTQHYQTITFDFNPHPHPQTQITPRQTQPKKKKQNIPKNIKTIVWNHYIGTNIIQHKCLCCKKVLICNTNFEVGHVISEKMGGTLEINNLRPICFACNHSMGTENMVDFVVKYGLYIG
jgi:hypothetical protein